MVSPGFFPRAFERRVLLIVAVCQTFSHLHITSSNPHIFSSSRPHIFTSSHLHIFSSSHLHIFISSHLLIFTSSHSLLPSCSLALFFFPSSFLFLSEGAGQCNETARNATLPHETRLDRQNWGENVILQPRRQPFRTKQASIAKNWSKIAIFTGPAQPFRTSIVESCGKMALFVWQHGIGGRLLWFIRFDVQTCSKIAISQVCAQPFRTKWWLSVKNGGEIAILEVGTQLFRTKWWCQKLGWNCA